MQDILLQLQQPVALFGTHNLTLSQLLSGPAALVVGWIVIRWSGRLLRNRLTQRGIDADVIQLVSRAFHITAIGVLILTTLELLNVPLTAFAFVTGAIAIGFGFGAQNIINNFISGWILIWERPIRIGDFLEIGDARGTVDSINTRSTRVRRVDGVHLLVPNSYLLENIVVNWTLVDRLTRSVVRVGVAYGSPVKQVAELIEQAVRDQADVLAEPAPKVIFEDFGDNALIFEAYFWIENTKDRDARVIRSNVRYRLAELFDAHGIVVAFPQQDVHLDGTLRLETDGAPP